MNYEGPIDQLPALRARRGRAITDSVDQTRRLLWRAFQHGELSEDEFARTLERLEPDAVREHAKAPSRFGEGACTVN